MNNEKEKKKILYRYLSFPPEAEFSVALTLVQHENEATH
jgi:hypothetical protein